VVEVADILSWSLEALSLGKAQELEDGPQCKAATPSVAAVGVVVVPSEAAAEEAASSFLALVAAQAWCREVAPCGAATPLVGTSGKDRRRAMAPWPQRTVIVPNHSGSLWNGTAAAKPPRLQALSTLQIQSRWAPERPQ